MKSSKQRGVAAVEMAVVLLPLLILCFGITEVGRALYQYNGLVKATRGAARYLSRQNLNAPPPGKTATDLRHEAIFMALCGKKTCSAADPPLVPDLELAQIAEIAVCDPINCVGTHANQPTGQGSIDLVSVTIGLSPYAGAYRYQGAAPAAHAFTSLIPWVIPDFSFGPITTTMSVSTF